MFHPHDFTQEIDLKKTRERIEIVYFKFFVANYVTATCQNHLKYQHPGGISYCTQNMAWCSHRGMGNGMSSTFLDNIMMAPGSGHF